MKIRPPFAVRLHQRQRETSVRALSPSGKLHVIAANPRDDIIYVPCRPANRYCDFAFPVSECLHKIILFSNKRFAIVLGTVPMDLKYLCDCASNGSRRNVKYFFPLTITSVRFRRFSRGFSTEIPPGFPRPRARRFDTFFFSAVPLLHALPSPLGVGENKFNSTHNLSVCTSPPVHVTKKKNL